MHFSTLLATLASLTGLASAVALEQRQSTVCDAAERRRILEGVPPGFNAVPPGESAAFIASLPLIPSCTLTLFINGAPGIQVAPDASTVRNFALLVRQAFYRVTPGNPESVDFGNGTTRSELEINTGVLHTISLPVNFHAGLIFNYLPDCTIESVVGILTIPTFVLGIPILPANMAASVKELASRAASMGEFEVCSTTP